MDPSPVGPLAMSQVGTLAMAQVGLSDAGLWLVLELLLDCTLALVLELQMG